MKNSFGIILLLLILSSCFGESNNSRHRRIENAQNTNIDTISVLQLTNKFYENNIYEILHLYHTDSRAKIQILKNDGAESAFLLPLADIEVKNFSVDEIKETKRGFKISVNWGGGSYFYSRVFYFDYKSGIFYLTRIVKNNFIDNIEEKPVTKNITPPVSIRKLNFSEYIKND